MNIITSTREIPNNFPFKTSQADKSELSEEKLSANTSV